MTECPGAGMRAIRMTSRFRSPAGFRSTLHREPLGAKVPEITVLFWAIKLLTTYMGEAMSDFLGHSNVVLGAGVEVFLVVLALWLQFRTDRYFAPTYWFLAMAIAIFGTGVADAVHQAGIPYAGTSALWAIILAIIFWRWYKGEGTLSIHSVTTNRREKFYWATVFATFALGTAVGDLTATSMNLGFLLSGVVFAGIFLIPLVGWWRFRLNAVLAFWFAYVLTRPLGASFADYVSKPRLLSGIDFGDGQTAGVATIAIVILVAYLTITRNDIQRPTADRIAKDPVASTLRTTPQR
jgi:uncharacterized membrane-anchored protein